MVRRGADVGSDHALVIAKIKLKLRKTKKRDQREPPVNVAKLKDPAVKKIFQIEVRNSFTALQNQQEMDLHNFNEVLCKAGKKVLGPRRRRNEAWISEETWKKIEERKEKKKKIHTIKSERMKAKLQKEYSTLDKEVKKRARADKKTYIENIAEEAETAAAKQDMGTLYKLTKTLTNGFQSTDIPTRDQTGKVLTKEDDKLRCWKEHFQRVLNGDDPETEANITPATELLDIEIIQQQ